MKILYRNRICIFVVKEEIILKGLKIYFSLFMVGKSGNISRQLLVDSSNGQKGKFML